MKRLIVMAVCVFFLNILVAFAQNVMIPNTIKDAKIGDWVIYKDAISKHNQKQTVVKIDEKEVTVSVEIEGDSQKIFSHEKKIPKDDMPKNNDGETKITKEKVKVNGKELICVVLESGKDSNNVKIYFCKDIPVSGIVRIETAGQVVMEIVAWGKK